MPDNCDNVTKSKGMVSIDDAKMDGSSERFVKRSCFMVSHTDITLKILP